MREVFIPVCPQSGAFEPERAREDGRTPGPIGKRTGCRASRALSGPHFAPISSPLVSRGGRSKVLELVSREIDDDERDEYSNDEADDDPKWTHPISSKGASPRSAQFKRRETLQAGGRNLQEAT